MNGDLFRSEAVQGQSKRLYGTIVVKSSTTTSAMTALISIITVTAIIFIVFGRFSRTEPAKGVMVPVGGASKIYAAHSGVVSAFMVKEGDLVKAGQKLAIVKLETPSAAGTLGTVETLDSLQTQRGIAAEQLSLSRQRSHENAARLDGVIQGLYTQKSNIEEQIALQKELTTSALMLFNQLDVVVSKGFVSRFEYEKRRQSALAARQELSRLNQQLSSTNSEIMRTKYERSNIQLEGKSQQASGRSAIEELRQQRSRIEGEASYLVEAPLSGRVTAVQTGVGQTVGNSVPMMVVMPEGAKLRADIYVPSRAIGFIKTNQEVRLLYDAFPYQRFGSFSARIETISRIAVAGAETNAPFKIDEPVYKVTVIPERQQISAYGKPIALQPGMTLVANIVLERQTFLDWFLSPIRAVANRN